MQNDEKKYKITKVEEYDSLVSSKRKELVGYALATGMFTINSAMAIVYSVTSGNPAFVPLTAITSAISIFGIMGYPKELREYRELKDERNKFVDETNGKKKGR